MKIAKIVDLLLTLLPGSRSDPGSLEARIRRATSVTAKAIEKAVDHETAIRNAVQDQATSTIETHISQVAYHAQQLTDLLNAHNVVKPSERAALASAVRDLNLVLEHQGL